MGNCRKCQTLAASPAEPGASLSGLVLRHSDFDSLKPFERLGSAGKSTVLDAAQPVKFTVRVLRADIDSLDGYRNRSRYYRGIAHEVPIRAVAATVMSV